MAVIDTTNIIYSNINDPLKQATAAVAGSQRQADKLVSREGSHSRAGRPEDG